MAKRSLSGIVSVMTHAGWRKRGVVAKEPHRIGT